tara:strand:- start:479 stop:625 length:147 start_codon:yes stop_codon:yes gene_type:complete
VLPISKKISDKENIKPTILEVIKPWLVEIIGKYKKKGEENLTFNINSY